MSDPTRGWSPDAVIDRPHSAPSPSEHPGDGRLSRRRFLISSAALGATAVWSPIFRVGPASAQATCFPPPNFPGDIALFQQAFENWTGEIAIDDLWTCQPQTPADVVTLANWARAEGYQLRARGFMHNWSPIHVTADTTCHSPVVLVDMTAHFGAMSMESHSPPAVRTQAGASMEDLLAYLEDRGYGVTSCPAPGGLTVGGVLAIDGHGTGVPADGETRKSGQTFGSFSNRILEITCVAWDASLGAYALRTVHRSEADARALGVALGRTIVTEVVLRVETNHDLRCQSWIDIPASELFAPAGSGGRTFESYLEDSGRIEAIWFPYTEKPWLKVWTVRSWKPFFAKRVTSPYNYGFSDNLPDEAVDLIQQILNGAPGLTPAFGQLMYDLTATGLILSWSFDLWGKSRNLLHYVRPTTLRTSANGYAILTRRENVQRVVHEFVTRYQAQLAAYTAQGKFPINGPMEIRVTGLDHADEADHPGAQEPGLSALAPRTDHPEWDVAVWLDLLTVPGTPHAAEFYSELEAWMWLNYAGTYASIRVEWSKGWGYTAAGPWTSSVAIDGLVPESLRIGRPAGGDWDDAVARLDALDPHRVFTNPFLDDLVK